jgi:hypothetical protein
VRRVVEIFPEECIEKARADELILFEKEGRGARGRQMRDQAEQGKDEVHHIEERRGRSCSRLGVVDERSALLWLVWFMSRPPFSGRRRPVKT